MTGEPEPTGYELMRAINSLRASFDTIATGMVTQATLAIWQQAQKEKDDRQDARLKAVEVAQDKRREEREREQAETRKTRSQQNFAIVMSILAAALSLGAAFILKGVTP